MQSKSMPNSADIAVENNSVKKTNKCHLGVLLEFTGFYLGSLDMTKFYWVLLGFTGFYWVLQGFIVYNWVLLCITRFDWV